MKKYFYSDGKNSLGPFTIEELKEKGVTGETMIWFQELGGWKKAGMIQELNSLFSLAPPPIQQQAISHQQTVRQSGSDNKIDLFIVLSLAYWLTTNLANLVMQRIVSDWYNTPAKFFQIGTNIVFAAIPIVFALSVRNKSLKNVALILGALLSIYILYNNMEWLMRELV